jgi:hypothetical protein
MGKPGWEDSAWTPGRPSRGGRTDNGGQLSSSGHDRTGRGDPDPRGNDRSDRRPPRYTDDAGWDRQRSSSSREDTWRGSSGGRPAAGGNRRSGDEQGSYSDFDRSGAEAVIPVEPADMMSGVNACRLAALSRRYGRLQGVEQPMSVIAPDPAVV